LAVNGIFAANLKDQQIISSNLYKNYRFIKLDISDSDFLMSFMLKEKFECVINLAAQAGVRYSLSNPSDYAKSNMNGFLNLLEGCRHSSVKHFIYASSSSVYGLNQKMPLIETMTTDHPISLYAATKKANELMAHSYSHLFHLPTTGLRFFTVYGPWGRPDMALFTFANSIYRGEKIKLFNFGKMVRDFTYVDDIVEVINKIINKPPKSNLQWDPFDPTSNSSSAPYKIFNVGNSNPISILKYILELEKVLGLKANVEMLPIQPGDVPFTHADNNLLKDYINFNPSTSYIDGVKKFGEWYKNHYKIDRFENIFK
jgi:UDP-glucuronate 4-epimerase